MLNFLVFSYLWAFKISCTAKLSMKIFITPGPGCLLGQYYRHTNCIEVPVFFFGNVEALSASDRKSVQRSFGKISLSNIHEKFFPLRQHFERRVLSICSVIPRSPGSSVG